VNHWRYNWDTDVVLDEPANQVYVKYTGNPGLNAIRACLHLLGKQPAQTRARVVHVYRIDEQLQTKTIDVDCPESYVVTCDGEPENIFVKISVPSEKRPDRRSNSN